MSAVKRPACPSDDSLEPFRCTSRRTTRSSARQERELELKNSQAFERASALKSNPTLQALSFVFTSGYLYQADCMIAASCCQDWFLEWKAVEEELPSRSKVEVYVEDISGGQPAAWTEPLKEDTLYNADFYRQIFNKVNELKVAAKKGKTARQKARDRFPVWGLDIQVVMVRVWGPNGYNNGGMCIDLSKRDSLIEFDGKTYLTGRATAKYRLHPDLTLWTGLRTWDVYDGTPLYNMIEVQNEKSNESSEQVE